MATNVGDFFAKIGFELDKKTVQDAHAAFKQVQEDQRLVMARYAEVNKVLTATATGGSRKAADVLGISVEKGTGAIREALRVEVERRNKQAAKDSARDILGPSTAEIAKQDSADAKQAAKEDLQTAKEAAAEFKAMQRLKAQARKDAAKEAAQVERAQQREQAQSNREAVRGVQQGIREAAKALRAQFREKEQVQKEADRAAAKQQALAEREQARAKREAERAAKQQARQTAQEEKARGGESNKAWDLLRGGVQGFLALRAVQYIRGVAEATAELATETKFTAERLGLSTSALQQLQFAATSTNVSTEALNTSLQSLQRNSLQFTKGLASTEVMRSFMQLGVGGRQLKGTGVDEQLSLIADGFQKVVDPAKRLQIATTLFGESGARLVPLLAKGRDGISALRKEAVALGGGLSGTAIAALEDSTIATKKLDFVLTSLKGNIAASIAPWFTKFVDIIRGGVERLRAFEKQTHLVAAVLRGGLVIGLVQVARTLLSIGRAIGLINIATFLGWGLVIAGVIVLMDELYSFFTGEKKSAISKWVDEFAGLGTAAEILRDMKASLGAIFNIAKAVNPFASSKSQNGALQWLATNFKDTGVGDYAQQQLDELNDERGNNSISGGRRSRRHPSGSGFASPQVRSNGMFRVDLDSGSGAQTVNDFDPFGDPTHYPRIMRQLPSQAVLTGNAGSLPNGPGSVNTNITNYIVNPDPVAVGREITRQNKQAITRARAAIPPTDGKR